MYQYYTLDECYKLRRELHVPWEYIEECTGIRRYTIVHAKNRLTDPDAKKRACVLCTVAIRSYMESGVATAEEKKLFESFESKKKEESKLADILNPLGHVNALSAKELREVMDEQR